MGRKFSVHFKSVTPNPTHMRKSISPALIELCWIVLAAILAWFLRSIFYGYATVDINLYDTYYVVSPDAIMFIPLFLFITYVIYVVKEAFYRYRRTARNVVMLVTGLSVLVLMNLLQVTIFYTSGMAFVDIKPLPRIEAFINKADLPLFIIVIGPLLSVMYRWGLAAAASGVISR